MSPLFRLPDFGPPCFPAADQATPDGLLAFGGCLNVKWLTAAYERGIFPWYERGSPFLWWSPDPRFVLLPACLHIPASLRRRIHDSLWKITLDADFGAVMHGCATTARPGQSGTWIVPEMEHAYGALHAAGKAHSLEIWREGKLAGGVYGVALGQVFFGESMFYYVPEASKVGFVWLVRLLEHWGYRLIDCQQATRHLARFGAFPVARKEFLRVLPPLVSAPVAGDAWRIPEGFHPLELPH